MPLYEFQCDACGHRLERIQKFSDPLLRECPVCHGAVRKLLSSPAIQFKGSGWYITDYARKAAEPGAPDRKTDGSGAPAPAGDAAKSSSPSDASSSSSPAASEPAGTPPKSS